MKTTTGQYRTKREIKTLSQDLDSFANDYQLYSNNQSTDNGWYTYKSQTEKMKQQTAVTIHLSTITS